MLLNNATALRSKGLLLHVCVCVCVLGSFQVSLEDTNPPSSCFVILL